jgi:hypothetical protein
MSDQLEEVYRDSRDAQEELGSEEIKTYLRSRNCSKL